MPLDLIEREIAKKKNSRQHLDANDGNTIQRTTPDSKKKKVSPPKNQHSVIFLTSLVLMAHDVYPTAIMFSPRQSRNKTLRSLAQPQAQELKKLNKQVAESNATKEMEFYKTRYERVITCFFYLQRQTQNCPNLTRQRHRQTDKSRPGRGCTAFPAELAHKGKLVHRSWSSQFKATTSIGNTITGAGAREPCQTSMKTYTR